MHAYCRVAILRPTLVARDRRLLACSWIGPTAPSHFGSWSDCGLTVNERHLSLLPSRPREFHPEPLTDSGRDTLASSGSCHRTKAAAFRWECPVWTATVLSGCGGRQLA